MGSRESCRGVFSGNNILTVYGLYIYECLMFFIKNRQNFRYERHNYSTRSLNLPYPSHRLTLTEGSPYYRCIKFYNRLPDRIKSIESVDDFKRCIRGLLLKIEPYSIVEYLEYNESTEVVS